MRRLLPRTRRLRELLRRRRELVLLMPLEPAELGPGQEPVVRGLELAQVRRVPGLALLQRLGRWFGRTRIRTSHLWWIRTA